MNLADQLEKKDFEMSQMCNGFLGIKLPCFSFYSRIDEHLEVVYPITFIVFGLLILNNGLNELSIQQTKRFKIEQEDNTGHQ